jgi:hypothetical protein
VASVFVLTDEMRDCRAGRLRDLCDLAAERALAAAGVLPVSLLPDAPLDDDTEFAFIDGRPFVNSHKHEQVCDQHIERAERAEALVAVLSWAREATMSDYRKDH